MMKIVLFCMSLFVFSSNAFCGISNVKLLYDKNEVYKENYFKVRVRVEMTNGKVFFSDVHKRFNCDAFNITADQGVRIGTRTRNDIFGVHIDSFFESDYITIKLQHKYGSQNEYVVKVPVQNYVNEVESIEFSNSNFTVNSNTSITLGVVAQMKNSNFINAGIKSKLKLTDFKFTVLKGGVLIGKQGEVRINEYDFCDHEFKVKVELRSNPDIFYIGDFNIVKNNPELNFRGKASLMGDSGVNGSTKTRLFDSGKPGVKGKNGYSSDNGGNGHNKILRMDLVFNDCFGASFVKVEVLNSDRKVSQVVYLYWNTDILNIDLRGGDGGNGGDGGEGQAGKNGKYYWNPEGSTAFSGGNGGDGGDAGNGGDGGNGGNLIIYYTKAAKNYLTKISVINHGGRAGRGGRGGKFGVGGKVGNGTEGNAHDGQNGRSGRDGHDGRDGRSGTVQYILTND